MKEMKEMLKVPQQEHIKYLREIEGLSISQIKEKLGIDWRTAKRYADKDDLNEPLIKIERPCPVMDSYKEIVDTWINDQLIVYKSSKIFMRRASSIFQNVILYN